MFYKNKYCFNRRLTSYILVLALIFSTLSLKVEAYVGNLGNVKTVNVDGSKLILRLDNGNEPNDDILEIQICENNIFKFNYRPNEIQNSDLTPMVDKDRIWDFTGGTIDTTSDPIILSTTSGKIEISKYPCRITVKNSYGESLLWETSSTGMFYNGIRFKHDSLDNIYGIRGYDFTENTNGILRNNSTHPAHAGSQGDSGGPFIWSTSGYGVLVDSDGGYPYTNSQYGKLEFYYGDIPEEGRRYSKNNLEYYVMLGSPKEIMKSFSEISGKSPILPKWSLGFSNFQWDSSETEVFDIIDTYRAKDIPIDSFGLDYDWKKYGEDNYGEFRWNTYNFPSATSASFKAMMDNKGIKLIGITKPRIVTEDMNGNRTSQYNYANTHNFWYPGHNEYQDYFIPVKVRSIDPYNKDVREWYWSHSKNAYDKGISAWWNDETDKVSSGSAQYWFGNFTTLHLSQAMYEGQRDYDQNSRIWQTARTYYPGAQRYATTLWSGDIGIQYHKGEKIDWTVGMKEQKDTMLSSINLGQTKWGMDIGGFNQADGTVFNPEPELYSKWMAFGSLVPVFRVHGNNHQKRQPWLYGKTAEEISKYAIQMRYSLLPYIYAYERTAYEVGLGLVRPLIFDYPNDENLKNYTDAWMFGDYILASPVLEKGQLNKSIYLPDGNWIDYNTGIEYQGGRYIDYSLDSETWTDIPMFIKDGAIIPNQKVMDYVDQVATSEISVNVFPTSAETSFTYYDDSGNDYNYENGEFFKQKLKAKKENNEIKFTVKSKEGTYNRSAFNYFIKIYDDAANMVKINNIIIPKKIDYYDAKKSTGDSYFTGKDIYGDYTCVKVSGGSSIDKHIVLSGTNIISNDYVKYEAEESSMFGQDIYNKASVNNNHLNYSGEGFVDKLDKDGSGITIYTKVKTSGDYPLKVKYSSATGNAEKIGLYINGKYVDQISFESLSNWDTWSYKEIEVPLTKGHNAITFETDIDTGDTGKLNIDFVDLAFVPNRYKYEAENSVLSDGAKTNTNHYYYSGTAFVDSYDNIGANSKFYVYVDKSDTYNVSLRYANGTGSTKTLSNYVNGVDVQTLYLDSNSNNWNDWNNYNHIVTLTKGINIIEYKRDANDSGQVNLDRVVLSTSPIISITSEKNILDNGNFERASDDGAWNEWHPAGQAIAYGIDSGSGINPPESAHNGNNRVYMWSNNPYKQSIHQVKNLPNGDYKFKAWVKVLNATPNIARAEISNYGGSQINLNINSNNWQLVSCDFSVTNGFVDIGFYVDSPGYTTLQIDDVSLEQIN